mmetsp:Transcript_168808/g.536740  ORF Transcript_168808/g.536740 Transcript_168808/m.536740 type:complete len:372 (-) Transcript_168808:314-1429(-)
MQPTGAGFEGRTSKTSKHRKMIQGSSSSAELLSVVRRSIDQCCIDASVFGAALQRCGQGRWWSALSKVRKLQMHANISLFSVEGSIYSNALMRSIRDSSGDGIVTTRQKQLVSLGREVWHEVLGHAEIRTPFLNSALRLCSAAADREGLIFGEEMWLWAKQAGLKFDRTSYASFGLLLEVNGLCERVDSLLVSSGSPWPPDCVDLSAVVNAAGELRDWGRADQLWQTLTGKYKVVAHTLAYSAFAKAQLLSGRLVAASRCIDEMLDAGLDLVDPALAVLRVQASLVLFHASLAQPCSRRLDEAFRNGESIIQGASASFKYDWRQIRRVQSRLRQHPSSVRLHDVLIGWNLARSDMAKWDNYCAGSAYLAGR